MSFGSSNQAANIQANADLQAQQMADTTQTNMFNLGMDNQKANYQTTEGQLQPYMDTGTNALSQLNAGEQQGGQFSSNFSLNDLTTDPGYQFDLQQGTQAVQRSAAANGTLNSGGTLKAISNYTTGLASGEINNAYNRYVTNQTNQFNRLSSLAGIGSNAVAISANAGANQANAISNSAQATGNQISNNQLTTTMAAGNATAGGVTGSANFLNGTLGSIASNVSQYAADNNRSLVGALGGMLAL